MPVRCSWLLLHWYSVRYSLVGTICTCLILTAGSFDHESAAGGAPRVQDGGKRRAASWDATGSRGEEGNEPHVHGGYEELLTNIPEQDLIPAYRALQRGVELNVRRI